MAPRSTLLAFVKLGDFFAEFLDQKNNPQTPDFQRFEEILLRVEAQNSWFTQENLHFALEQWANLLTEKRLTSWLAHYPLKESASQKTVAIIMAGNIPLVGFHDFLCVLLSGNTVLGKLSSNDTLLLPFISGILTKESPELRDRIRFTEGKLDFFDAVIATGSNNTSRYFEHYFGKYPNIIRKNRNSIAILSGNERENELHALGKDIFQYFGLGCRSVSKLYVPSDYNFEAFFQAIFPFQKVIHQHKYANNYDYNKAVYLMSDIPLLDNGFLILKEDQGLASPISCLFYEYYENETILKRKLASKQKEIQCVVSKGCFPNEVAFGQTQTPSLSDYADGLDTLDFLLNLKG